MPPTQAGSSGYVTTGRGETLRSFCSTRSWRHPRLLYDDEIELDRDALHEELFHLFASYLLRDPPARG
jgi:hypothetical protein